MKYIYAEPVGPPLVVRAKNLAVQSVQEAAARARRVPPPSQQEIARRISICRSNACGQWRASDETCALCGCQMVKKAPWRSARCKARKW